MNQDAAIAFDTSRSSSSEAESVGADSDAARASAPAPVVTDYACERRSFQSKLSLALDALRQDRPHAQQSVRSCLSVLAESLCSLHKRRAREGAFDARVLALIDATRHGAQDYRTLLNELATHSALESEPIIAFLEQVLALKQSAANDQAYLWRDAPAFVARELFVSTVAVLLRAERWPELSELLNHRFSHTRPIAATYSAFDGFHRSLDVFRKRRLKLARTSVSADLLKARVERGDVRFDDVIQADFVLHVHSVFHEDSMQNYWYPRTLCYAEKQLVTGTDLFINMRAGNANKGLCDVFGVDDWSAFNAALGERVCLDSGQNPLNIDYAGLIGANNALFD
ncbi:MAG: hypothetical protein AAF465_06915 [Pseudomonadota bacterium]